ncbi:unnamed protein product [Cuscuta epithymum]|uniref:Uncharacterized protein n=1 Tax=Cuscuta epithymum TaxID=186058 RepID=A0AAV0BYD8_9ASTE|nr:unnamed protein product [Cuscuta epithymum]
MLEFEVKLPSSAIDQAPRDLVSNVESNRAWDLLTPCYEGDSNNDFSISGLLFQADIENHVLVEKFMVLNIAEVPLCSEAVLKSDSSIATIKDYFQNTMTNGVDSLSHFLISEFEKILASFLGDRDTRAMKLDDVEKTSNGILEDNNTIKGNKPSVGDECVFVDHIYSYSADEFLGHASKSEKRPPISSMEDLWDSDTNQDVCNKATLATWDNYLPTLNLNTQIKLYRKKHQRSHIMRTRSQSRMDLFCLE